MVSYTSVCNNKNELLTIDSIRQHIIDGNAYRVWDTSFNVAADGSMNFAFVSCANKTNKVKFFIECDQSCNLRMIEDASWNVGGGITEITGYNFNRSSTNTMTCKLYKAPSMAGKWASGTVISSKWAFAVNVAGNQGRTAFGTNADEYSMILAPGKLYVFNLVNKGALAGSFAVHMRITQGTV
jgi:hypothetical protein